MSAMEGWILVCLILALPIQLVASKHLVHKHHHKRTTDSPPVCSDSEFSCDINRCIPRIWLCDSETDCADGTDEANCTIGCQYDQWRCHDGSKCIRDSWRCDGDRDCPDGSDETNCTTGCPSGEWRCHNGQRCINSNWLCDGDNDCYDSSDELNCTGTTTTARPDCISDQFACDNGNCITGRYTCDGDNDCGDGSDERNCNVSTTTTTRPACTSDEFQCDNGNCVTGRYVCDRDNDCGDGSDERNCTISCPSGEWRCHDGQRCINSNWLCDGDNDCYDHSDERNCTGNTTRPTTARPGCASDEFQCDNGNCVTGRYVCDRDNDCGDGSDERNCTIICPSGEWRCHDGQRCINSNWLCDGDNDCYDHSDELNCTGTTRPPTARPGCASDEFQCDNGNCVTGRYVCDRDNDCGDGSDERNCTITCGTGEWLCHDGNLCIRSNWICDGDQDCPDGSDERNCTSCVEGEFRCGNGRCVPETYVCDGDVDCVDGADEIDCGIVRPSTVPPTRPPGSCWPFRWQCDNGACVSFYAVCNGVDDCGDGSEETFCGLSTGNPSTAHPSTDYPTTTRPSTTNRPTTECPVSCNNGQCLYHESWICDGEIDCLDGSDELNCYVVEECINSTLGLEYRGQTSTTMNGRTCQRWDSQYPHEHSRDDQSQFPDAVYNEENYCRNPDHEGQGPWCYTTDPDVRWEYCGIPACEAKECKTSILGVEYRGQRSSTSSGRTCQPWDSQYPHEHLRNDQSQFPDAVYNEENYCRNPDHEPEGPWCYTTDPNVRWEYCGIPLCEDCKASMRGGEYRGGLATTVSGRTCQQWTSQYPHEHTRNDQTQFPGAVYNKDNFCRNPDGEAEGPWCYTTDPDKRWEYCDIPFCDEL